MSVIPVAKFKHRSELLYINLAQPNYEQQLFSWRDDESGETTHYDVSTMQRAIDANPQAFELRAFECNNKHANHIAQCAGIEFEHLLRLAENAKQPPGMARLLTPGIMIELIRPGRKPLHILMDGNHRYCVLTKARQRSMAFWVVSDVQAEQAELILSAGLKEVL